MIVTSYVHVSPTASGSMTGVAAPPSLPVARPPSDLPPASFEIAVPPSPMSLPMSPASSAGGAPVMSDTPPQAIEKNPSEKQPKINVVVRMSSPSPSLVSESGWGHVRVFMSRTKKKFARPFSLRSSST
ncbi:MAG: hypothetical protein ACRELY_05285 [Polyangiaceae bacterium]